MTLGGFIPPEIPDESELGRILRGAVPAIPRPEFKRGQRAEFLGQGDHGMASRPGKAARSQDDFMATTEDNLRQTLHSPPANSDFKAELRQRFIDYGRVANLESTQAMTGARVRPNRGLVFKLGILAAAAAAAIFVKFYLPVEVHWRVHNLEVLDTLLVDGRSAGPLELRAALGRGALLETGVDMLDLELSLGLSMRVLPESSIEFFPLPEAGAHQELAFQLKRGELYLETDAGFAGHQVRVLTEDAEVLVVGTALGILVNELGTCTCVEHGTVQVWRVLRPTEPAELVGLRSTLFVNRLGAGMQKGFDEFGDPPHAQHIGSLERFVALD